MDLEKPLRVGTFNIKHGARKDGYKADPTELAEACADLDLDILGLQEVDKGIKRSGFANLGRVVAKATGMNSVFARSYWFHCGQYGNALLARGEISDVTVLHMHGDRRHRVKMGEHKYGMWREPRSAIVASVNLGRMALSVANTHLATDKRVSPNQLEQTLDTLLNRTGPHVMLGDLNLGEAAVRQAVGSYSAKQETSCEAIDIAHFAGGSIDHILATGFGVSSTESHWLAVSDHQLRIAVLSPLL